MLQPNNAPNWRKSFFNAGAGTLVFASLVLSVLAFVFAATVSNSPCASAQTTSCNVGDDEIFTGAVDFQDEINVGATPGPGTAGQLLVSSGPGASPEWASQTVFITKAADENVNNSTTLQDDDDFTFTVDANSYYQIEMGWLESSDSTADIKFQWSLPGTGEIDGNFNQSTTWNTFSEASTASLNGNGVGTINVHDVSGFMRTDTAGTATFQWAQLTAQANNATFHEGSWMSYRKLN